MADTVKWGTILFKAQAILRELGSSGETSASPQELLDLADQLDKICRDEWFRVEHLGREPRVIAWSPQESWEARVQAILDQKAWQGEPSRGSD
jgi:hypothetical protein